MNEIIQGDCLEEMRGMKDNSISAIVTDPPYGLHFMGKDWDKFKKTNFDESGDWNTAIENGKERIVRKIATGNSHSGTYDPLRDDEFQSFIREVSTEALRIVRPGGHILMFGSPRRHHRQMSGLEDAGWEIRDCLMWIFGSGFPKSHNHFGIEGYGTALKPAYEPIIMAMKPLDGTFAQNAERWGQAGINIEGCRIESKEDLTRECMGHASSSHEGYKRPYHELAEKKVYGSTKGRWPANVIFDEEAGKMLDEQSGHTKSSGHTRHNTYPESPCYGKINPSSLPGIEDKGGASRFFYCAKASSRERNEGLDELPVIVGKRTLEGGEMLTGSGNKRSDCMKNNHPTVKPLKLMEYLIRLVMPPKDGILLDPFAGSGTTILAAQRLGFKAIGIEKQKEYCEIARARLTSYAPESREPDLVDLAAQ